MQQMNVMLTADAKARFREKEINYHQELKILDSKRKEVQKHAALEICKKAKVRPGQNEFDCASYVIRCKCSAREKKDGVCGNKIDSPLKEIVNSLLPLNEPNQIRTYDMVNLKLEDVKCFGNNPQRKQQLEEAVKGVYVHVCVLCLRSSDFRESCWVGVELSFDFTVFADYDIRQKQIDVLKDEVNNFQERDAQRRKEIDIATKDWKNVSVGI